MSIRSIKRKAKSKKFFSKSFRANPDKIHSNLFEEADQLFIRANQLYQERQYVHAQEILESIVTNVPNHLAAIQMLGDIQLQTGQYQAALQTYSHGLPCDGDDLHCKFGFIGALIALNRIEEAFLSLDAIPIKDNRVCDVYYKLGIMLSEKYLMQEALDSFRKLLQIAPDFAGAHYRIGMIYEQLQMHNEAIAAFEQAINHDNTINSARLRLAQLYNKLYLTDNSINYIDAALKLGGEKSEALCIAGQTYMQRMDFDQAFRNFLRAVEVDPENHDSHFNLLFFTNYLIEQKSVALMRSSLEWIFRKCTDRNIIFSHGKSTANKGRIRIGYISSDFRQHSVIYFFLPLLEGHDRSIFETYCYSNLDNGDQFTKRTQEAAEHWRPIKRLTDKEFAQQIYEDEIDILVELSGFTSGSRLLALAEQPAPIQVSWLGYPNTTGMPTIQYRLTDWVADPIGEGDNYTETLYRLPGSFLCYDPLDHLETGQEQEPLRLDTPFVFGSFNNIQKMNQPLVAVWAEILKQTANCRLLLKSEYLADKQVCRRLVEWFDAEGVTADQLDLQPFTDTRAEHFKMYSQMHLALDPFPYNGTTTTFEALWSGVPVLALRGNAHRSRVGASILTHLGLDDFIAADLQEYIHKAVQAAQNREALIPLRRTLRSRLQQSPLMDKNLFARQMEAAFQDMLNRG